MGTLSTLTIIKICTFQTCILIDNGYYTQFVSNISYEFSTVAVRKSKEIYLRNSYHTIKMKMQRIYDVFRGYALRSLSPYGFIEVMLQLKVCFNKMVIVISW